MPQKATPFRRPGRAVTDACLILAAAAVPLLIDLFVIRTRVATLWHDNDIGWFSLGVAWVSGYPTTTFHHPSMFFNLLSGVLTRVVGLDGTDASLTAFLRLGLVVQTAVLVVAALFCGFYTARHKFKPLTVLGIGLLTFSMPTVGIFAAHFSNYFMLGLVAMAIGVLLHDWLNGNETVVPPLGLAVGFAAANLYPLALIPLGLLLAATLPDLRVQANSSVPRGASYPPPVTLALLLVTFLIQASSMVMMAGTAAMKILLAVVFLSGAVLLAGLSIWIYRRWPLPEKWRLLHWMLIGWWGGALILAPHYIAFIIKGSSATPSLGWPPLELLVALPYRHPWMAISVALLVLALVMTARENDSVRRLKFLILLAVVVVPGLAFSLSLLSDTSDVPGTGVRGMIVLLPLLVAAWIYLSEQARLPQRARVALQALVSVCCLFQLGSLMAATWRVHESNLASVNVIDAHIERHLSAHVDAVVLCGRDELRSRYCATAYAYNRYRSISSRRRLPFRTLFAGRVVWLSEAELLEAPGTYLRRDARVLAIFEQLRLAASHPAYRSAPLAAEVGAIRLVSLEP